MNTTSRYRCDARLKLYVLPAPQPLLYNVGQRCDLSVIRRSPRPSAQHEHEEPHAVLGECDRQEEDVNREGQREAVPELPPEAEAPEADDEKVENLALLVNRRRAQVLVTHGVGEGPAREELRAAGRRVERGDGHLQPPGDGDAEELARVLDAGRDPLLVLARGELQEHGFEIGGDDVVRDAADGDADGDALGELDLQAVM